MSPRPDVVVGAGMRLALAALVVTVLALGAAACAGPSTKDRQERRDELIEAFYPELRNRLDRRVKACEQAVGGVLDQITQLDSRLKVGPAYGAYTSKLADIKLAYDRARVDGLDTWCLTTRSKAGRALRVYVGAAEYWNLCSDRGDCMTAAVDSELQEYWARARQWLDEAKVAFGNVASPPGDPELPRSGASVPGSVYATIREMICKEPDPPALQQPCSEFRATLLGGVDKDEEGELEDALEAMLDALGATT